MPNPPLAWDEHISKPHLAAHTAWAAGRGFEVSDSTGELTIHDVTIVGSTVELTLASAPTGTGLEVRHAVTQDGTGLQGGTDQGKRGQLRDSDDLVGYDAETLEVKVTSGSATVSSTKPGAFATRTGHDLATGAGAPADWVVAAKTSPDQLTMSAPWPGATGTVTLSMHYDQHNYCVQFVMPVTG